MKKPSNWAETSIPILCGLLTAVAMGHAFGQTYSYTYSGPSDSWIETDLSFGPGSDGGGGLNFGTLNETLYYNPIAGTLRQVGSVNLNSTCESFAITGFGGFYPGLSGKADLTINGGSDELDFDTGTLLSSGNGSLFVWFLNIPVSGTVMVADNGKTDSESVSYTISEPLLMDVSADDPASLDFSDMEADGGAIGESEVANVGGWPLFDGRDDGTYYCSCSLNSATAMAAPEPGNLTIIAFGAFGLWAVLRRRGRQRMTGHRSA
ncbi:MAG: hypothetical protein ACREE6_08550 [Limisphaerales bacterium]